MFTWTLFFELLRRTPRHFGAWMSWRDTVVNHEVTRVPISITIIRNLSCVLRHYHWEWGYCWSFWHARVCLFRLCNYSRLLSSNSTTVTKIPLIAGDNGRKLQLSQSRSLPYTAGNKHIQWFRGASIAVWSVREYTVFQWLDSDTACCGFSIGCTTISPESSTAS